MNRDRSALPDGFRIAWGLFFVAAAVFNAVVTLPNSEMVLESFAALALAGADTLLRALLPYAAGLVAAVVAMEAVVGALILSKGMRARAGLGASMAWLVGLIPFLGWYAVVNVLLTAALVPVVRREYPRSLYDMTFARAGRRRPGAVLRLAVLAVTAAMSLAGFFGGFALITDDNFVPGAYLEKTPFESWVIPGILLIAFVAVPMAVAAAVAVFRKELTGLATTAAGGLLAAWIVGQLTVLDYGMVLQPAMLLAGLGIAGAGLLLHARSGERPWRLAGAFDETLTPRRRGAHPRLRGA